ncbi:MAG: type II toxin-antitoxin system RelE family toxin [Anaerolineae bacterium]
MTRKRWTSLNSLTRRLENASQKKIDWLGENAGSIRHQQLAGLPENLKGLCRYRVGDYRVLYWLYPQRRELRVYGIIHRRTDYKILRG